MLLVVVAGTAMFANLVALVVGMYESRRVRRNMLPGAIQMSCYLSGYLTAWAAFGAVTILIVGGLAVRDVFDGLEILTGVYYQTLVVFTWLIPNLACCIWYFVLVARGTAAMRYANR